MSKAALALAATVLIGACAQRAPLELAEGQAPPPAPYGAEQSPDADDLLALPTLAAPERSVELRRRSEEREDDPFDLPPE